MSTFLEKFAPTVADAKNLRLGAAVPGAAGAVAGYAAWRHMFPKQRYSQTHKMPAVGVLAGMASGEVAHTLYGGGNVTQQVVVNALGILGSILLPKYAPEGIIRTVAKHAGGGAAHVLHCIAYPVGGFVAGKAIGFKLRFGV